MQGYWTVITQEGNEWTAEIWSRGSKLELAGRFTGPWAFVQRAVILAPVCVALWREDRRFSEVLMGSAPVTSSMDADAAGK
jgi:hypothetical protein